MSTIRLNQSPLKRTSHYYKKKLECEDEDQSISSEFKKSGSKIQKKPKEARLRAKEARQRKKKYIERLEQRIEMLENQLNTFKQKLLIDSKAIQSQNSAFINLNKVQKSAQTIQEIKDKVNRQSTSGFTEQIIRVDGIQGAFKRLYRAVSERNESQAGQYVNLLRDKFGVAGQDRNTWIQELLSKVVEISMPLHCRLLLQHCQNRQEFYKLLGGSQTLRQFRKVYFDQSTISTICQSRSTMIEIKQQYKRYFFVTTLNRIILKVEQLAYCIGQQAKKLQSEIDRIEISMNPLFIGRILVYLDMERKETEKLQEIFPVNFHREALIEARYNRDIMKFECEDGMYKQREDERMERISFLSEQENFLKDFFSQ